MSKLNTRE